MKNLLFITLFSVVLMSCANTTNSASNKKAIPFTSYQDFDQRKLSVRPYALLMHRITDIEILEIEFYTHGNAEAVSQIDSKIESVKYLTQHLRNKYPIKLMFIDGDPTRLVDGNPPGTFKVIKQVFFPKNA